MNCQEARRLFSLHLDNYLSPKEEAEVLAHVGLCPACYEELTGLKTLLEALRSLPGFTPLAPAGLVAGVMARLKEIEGHRPYLSGWKRWVAAAGVALTLAGSSLAYAARGWVPAKILAALNPLPQVGQVESEASGPKPDLNSGISFKEQEGNTTPSGVVDSKGDQDYKAPGEKAQSLPKENREKFSLGEDKGRESVPGPEERSSSPGLKPGPSRQGTPPEPQAVAQGQNLLPVTFLNKERKINSTFLKVAADDMEKALAAALKAGTGVGAAFEIVAVQNTGNSVRAGIRFTVTPQKASSLVESLSKLGTLLDKREESEDITARFSATLEQYREAVAKANAASTEKEREELISQAEFLEKQLSILDKEAGEQVIMLWLEKK
ncbi:Putative zinc-finger [Thermanaeromonas toyohensis ToBE]|uniref:Anti-sigma-W factor RsiW n=1 Tax=Thermanaeromonas toyohensis ToBE TaxID=698762 RepID=A0A1W1V845_9FIRM|nr:zf-HC2 domain-containing protein [Thermanaeromonas toyohensis]SMB89599.1 Putative zinc-finger [Thermanaeromonas toyohensis ToBE]